MRSDTIQCDLICGCSGVCIATRRRNGVTAKRRNGETAQRRNGATAGAQVGEMKVSIVDAHPLELLLLSVDGLSLSRASNLAGATDPPAADPQPRTPQPRRPAADLPAADPAAADPAAAETSRGLPSRGPQSHTRALHTSSRGVLLRWAASTAPGRRAFLASLRYLCLAICVRLPARGA